MPKPFFCFVCKMFYICEVKKNGGMFFVVIIEITLFVI